MLLLSVIKLLNNLSFKSYAAVNIRVVLVAIEIWTNGNKIPYVTSGGGQLSLFNKYRRNNLLGTIRHDIAHFMRYAESDIN